MTISVALEPHETYLVARLAGPFALEAAQAAVEHFIEAAVERQLSQILVDVRQVQGEPTVAERYLFAEFVAQAAVSQAVRQSGLLIKLAFVGQAPLMDPARFGMMVARNRGAQVVVVEDVNEALNWLGVTPT